MTATSLWSMFSIEELEEAINGGYVSVQSHPTLPLFIYNYTPAAQYERVWNNVTTQCRGLIVDDTFHIVARPFAKFFNYGETDTYDALPAGDPIVSEKMDGSLGIIYTYKGETAVATRGSFTSAQALWATEYLHKNHPDFICYVWDDVTTLVEIIYPGNRIVVDYKGKEGLVLLGAIWNDTGADIPILDVVHWNGRWWDGPVAEHYEYNSLEDAVALATGEEFKEAEGVVLCWPRSDGPSFRLKVKHPRYVELHRIVTNLSTRSVHEALANDTFDELIAVTPDEFHPWVRRVADELTADYDLILAQAEADLMDARWGATRPSDGEYSRKDLAGEIQKTATYPGLCFALEDGKDISSRIWDMIRPDREMAVILEAEG